MGCRPDGSTAPARPALPRTRWAGPSACRVAASRGAGPHREKNAVADPILAITGLNKSFGPAHVLQDIDFAVYPGEVTALVGDNGAGKSTLVKCVAGIYTADSGTITFEGKPVVINDPRVAAALGIEFVYQDLALADNLDITQNMFLGREINRAGFMSDGEMERKARETLTSLSVRTVSSVRQSVASLSGGQRQTVAIAKAVLWNSKVVFLDEPTAALGVAQTRQVLDLVRRLADQGLGRRAHLAQHERRHGGGRPGRRALPRQDRG